MNSRHRFWLASCFVALIACPFSRPAGADDPPVFSGPQAGEALPALPLQGVYDEMAGVEFDPVTDAKGKPIMLVIVHKITRPGLGVVRGLTRYAKTVEDAPSVSAIGWLDDDKSKAEQFLLRVKQSLNFNVPVGISVDGGEGPGSYGLNRNVELTILIAKDGKVVSNFALVQPSFQDGIKVATAFAKTIGKEPPTAEELQKIAYPGQRMNATRRQRPERRPPPAKKPASDTQ